MSYYQNGQYPYYNNGTAPSQAPQPQQYQNQAQYMRRTSSFDQGDDMSAGANGGSQTGYGYSSAERSGSVTARATDELFLGGGGGGGVSQIQTSVGPGYGQQYRNQSPQTSQAAYNPALYAQPIPQPNPQTFGGVVRTQTINPQPYNPAAYTDANVHRSNTTASHPYGFSPNAYSPSTGFPSPPQQQYSTPPLAQQHGLSQLPYRTTYSPPVAPPGSTGPSPARHPSQPQTLYPYPDADATVSNALPSPPTHQGRDSRHGSSSQSNYSSSAQPYSSANPLPPTPGPPPPQHSQSPQRSATTRRPLPPPPRESDSESDYFGHPNGARYTNSREDESISQDDLFNQVENAVLHAGTATEPSPRIELNQTYVDNRNYSQQSYTSSGHRGSEGGNGRLTNGHLSPNLTQYDTYNYSDESDIEAAAGLAAMQAAEEQEAADEARRQSGGTTLFSSYVAQPQSTPQENPVSGSDSDYQVLGDLSALGGGYGGHLSYGGQPAQLASTHSNVNEATRTISSSGSQRRSDREEPNDYGMGSIHPFPPFNNAPARVDTFGTGGLSEPSAHGRRLSYDEGDEKDFLDDHSASGTGDLPDMFYHPGMSQNRPLPPPPAGEAPHPYASQGGYYSQGSVAPYPAAPNQYNQYITGPANTIVPRSTSLLSHSTVPPAMTPIRSKTDAEERQERRLRQQQIRQSQYQNNDSGAETVTPSSVSAVALDLPLIAPGKRFNPAKLTPSDFKKCMEPWALSAIISWLRSLAEGEEYLKESALLEGLVALFTYKVPTMNIADAETLSARIVKDMYDAGTLVHEEEWLKFTAMTMTGVVFQLTGSGCYSSRLHNYSTAGRCYSYHCQRTLKKIDLQAQPHLKRLDDWATFYKLKKEDVENADKKEIERQNILHEIVQGEDSFMDSLNVLQVLYRDSLLRAQPPVIPPRKLDGFIKDVFGKVDAVRKANEDHLLPQMKYRQQEQGPWLVGYSDIFREWIRKAKHAYIEYAAAYPSADFQIRQEADRNMLFRSFLDQTRGNKMSNKLGWDNYLKSPITRLQRYGLLLNAVLHKTIHESEEKKNLQIAIEEIKAVTMECDARVAEMGRKVDLRDLQSKLILRPGMHQVELNLDHLGRELIFRGDLQRMGGNRFTWLETHALLFDHYLVLAKMVQHRDVDAGLKSERYDVSRLPIPMELLVLESENDPPVVKSAVKGFVSANATGGDPRLGRPGNPSPVPGNLQHTNTSSSLGSTNTQNSGKTLTTSNSKDDDKILYPFRVKHLGKETYTLFSQSASNRQDWCDKIREAKTKHAASLFSQNAEPFRLRVMADSAFAYESSVTGQKIPTIKGTPLDRAVDEVERLFVNSGRPGPICRAKVNCATAFNQPYGKQMVAVGTDFGVYISETENPRGWSRAIPIPRVTQVAVLEDFQLFLLISDKSLIAYHLDVVCPVGGVPPGNDSARKAPQKLSGNRDIGFFATGRMKDRTLVFYKKREGLSSTFKVLEPVYQKSTEKKSRSFLRSGRTEFFRDYDEFYIPAECFGINLYNSSLAVSTSKGFEVLTLDKKQPWSVPDLKAPAVASIATRLNNLNPLGMFRLSEQEFLLCYEECAVYVNKHGEISRSVVMEFVGKAKGAALYGPFVLLFDPDFVEIRNAQNGRLRQVIAGRDVRCLDDALSGGTAGNRTIKLALQHPEIEKLQIVVELLLNENQKE
ncbi:hypothetical protein M501DRAFT_943033 [Patellaria atrata CBS 101060]|uniref:Rho1 guanine nucleotide exchange factor 3 n=1 Tax=Patellaria atrata CBS 101060 TaxID=1346257 RepID=A0A9P4S488_9PEZI|nr:hypothetical protein M501DRAFT_943033 [Patellaria atrata CBS 101060]